ncbi:hypothetical protein [Segetibacter aerophilus]|uniref:Uncharacterized protein n=1 Tax=Segetibacter aerophilus TaxID=670293 RepID=A0A512BFV4_9BACT|nr:hypothetical protein [Segetibacter aerophilus]GEO10842.1 hypothetical protein SAE01_33380 [Segetibacter aerophilus]
MANEDKFQEQQNNAGNAESNAERDQDHGNMNNGTIGGNMGIIGSSNDADSEKYSKHGHDGGPATVPGDTGGGASDGSKAGSGLGPDGSVDNAASKHEGSATQQ